MKIIVDQQAYHLHIDRVAATLQRFYVHHKDMVDQEQTFPGGVKIDFGRKSLMRLAFKSTLVPLILPILHSMYESKGLTLRKKVQHEDLVDYIVENVLAFIAATEKDISFYVTTIEDTESFERHVTSVSATRPNVLGEPGQSNGGTVEEEAIEAD